jgi:nicotinate (nicotinamide) nucleotide adenylyltransferase
VLPGSFNPPTVAHFGLARAALAHADEVLFAIPRSFPHKEYYGATLDQRIQMLTAALPDRGSIGIAEGGLFIDIAQELRPLYPEADLLFVCGRDAAERIVNWPYDGFTIERILSEFGLLVADREGHYDPPGHVAHAVTALECGVFDEISSTTVRERIARDQEWEHLVPPEIRAAVRQIYSERP